MQLELRQMWYSSQPCTWKPVILGIQPQKCPWPAQHSQCYVFTSKLNRKDAPPPKPPLVQFVEILRNQAQSESNNRRLSRHEFSSLESKEQVFVSICALEKILLAASPTNNQDRRSEESMRVPNIKKALWEKSHNGNCQFHAQMLRCLEVFLSITFSLHAFCPKQVDARSHSHN
jgi:hypothetical protein